MKLFELNASKDIILVFGRLCSGKGTYCQQYVQNGFTHITTSDIVKRVSGKSTRDELQQTGNLDQRILSEMIDVIASNRPIVVDGIRQRSIVEGVIAEFGDHVELIWLDVPEDIRRERFKTRAAAKDTKTFDDSEIGDSALGLDDVEKFVRPNAKIVKNY